MTTLISYVSPDTGSIVVLQFDTVTDEVAAEAARVSDHPVEEGADITDYVRPELSRLSLKLVVGESPTHPVNDVVMEDVDGRGLLSGQVYGQESDVSLTVQSSGVTRSPKSSRMVKSFQVEGGYHPLTIPSVGGGFRLPTDGLSVPTNGFKAPYVRPTAKPSEWTEVAGLQTARFLTFDQPVARREKFFNILWSLCSLGIPVSVETDLRSYERMLVLSVNAPKDGTDSIEFAVELRQLRTAQTQNTFVKRKSTPAAKPAEKRAEAETVEAKALAPRVVEPSESLFSRGLNAYLQSGGG